MTSDRGIPLLDLPSLAVLVFRAAAGAARKCAGTATAARFFNAQDAASAAGLIAAAAATPGRVEVPAWDARMAATAAAVPAPFGAMQTTAKQPTRRSHEKYGNPT